MPRIPLDISWSEMEDSVDIAQSFISAFIMEDPSLQSEIARNFIFPAIESGEADKLVYGFATVATTIIVAISKAYEVDPLEMIRAFNQIRMDSPLEEDDEE